MTMRLAITRLTGSPYVGLVGSRNRIRRADDETNDMDGGDCRRDAGVCANGADRRRGANRDPGRADGMSVKVDLTDLQTVGAVCGPTESSKLPDEVDDNPGLSGLQPVVSPGTINFKVGPDCGGAGISFEVEAKGWDVGDNEIYLDILYQVSLTASTTP